MRVTAVLAMFTVVSLFVACGDGPVPATERETATFAGGCFWCLETAFEGLPGVISATSGYAGGQKQDPTYEEVSSGSTGHAESVQVVFDPAKLKYAELLQVFWHNIDPLTANAQFCDHGNQYRSAIFYANEVQRRMAEESKSAIEAGKRFDKPVVTQIVPLEKFYPAEAYHQDFYKKDPVRYKSYRLGCGRDARLRELWGAEAGSGTHPAGAAAPKSDGASKPAEFKKPGDAELQQRLTPLQYEVTQHAATERAFANEYWDNHRPGIYVDVVSGEVLFSSKDKFDSGTGWPSFTRPLVADNLRKRSEGGLLGTWAEVRSAQADSHLGHVFNDGPKPTGLRYCMNSAALRFIPAERLVQDGYGQYAPLFKDK